MKVFGLVVLGLLNKQIAAQLGIALQTVKAHRGRVMFKMCVESLAELVRMHERLCAAGRLDERRGRATREESWRGSTKVQSAAAAGVATVSWPYASTPSSRRESRHADLSA